MSPRHHPAEELIIDIARGAAPAAVRLVVQAHLGACAECRERLRLAEAVGGALLDELPPAELAPDALDRALAMLDTSPPEPKATASAHLADWIAVPPEVVTAAQRHRRWAAPGVWVAPLDPHRKRGPRGYLLGIGPGIAVPMHIHRGSEYLCVLKGAFEDRGELYGPGDFAESDESVEHRPRVTKDGACVCLVCADTLVPGSLTAHLFQPFVRI